MPGTKPRQRFADDIAGRFRSASLEEWRVTTGDPEVADRIYELLGGQAPQEWETSKEDNLEVFTAATTIEVIIEKASDLRQRMILWGWRGAVPSIELTFRLASDPELGKFQFSTGSWGLTRDLAAEDVEGRLAAIDGPARATLTLSPESFVPKNGPMKGKTVSFTKSELVIKGAVEA